VHWLQDSTLVAAEIFHQQAMIASSAARKFKFLNQKMTAVRLESLAVMGRSAVEDLVHDARCHQANDLQKATFEKWQYEDEQESKHSWLVERSAEC